MRVGIEIEGGTSHAHTHTYIHVQCMGCSSGEQSCGWEWMKDSRKGQISTEASYPYTSKGGSAAACKSSLGKAGATISGYASIPSNEVR